MTEPTAQQPPSSSGANILLLGETGSGKTYSIRTLIECGITPFILATEPGIADTLGDIDPNQCHWVTITPAKVSWDSLLATAKKINTMTYKMIAGLGDINKRDYNQIFDVMNAMNNFKCERTGEEFGDIGSWGTDRAIVLDGLSGLSQMAMDMTIGAKPTASEGEWGVAMNFLKKLIDTYTNSTRCWLVIIAHLEREKDEITGGMKLMASTLGKKLSPKLPRNFSDIILCSQEASKWTWSTQSTSQIDLKTRNLPIASGMVPSFVPLVENWKRKGGRIEA